MKTQIIGYSPPKVYIRDTETVIGRGAFADREFLPGEIVETSPVILIDIPMKDFPHPVQRLVFNWSKLCDAPERYALVLGYGSIYNHDDDPNMRYSADPEKLTMIYTAIQKIRKGEQLTVSYNQVPEGAEPRGKNWFEIHQVDKLDSSLITISEPFE